VVAVVTCSVPASGAGAEQVTLKVTFAVRADATVTLRGFAPPTVQLSATPTSSTWCAPLERLDKVIEALTPIAALAPPSSDTP